MASQYDVVVVGGGPIGLGAAYELAKVGKKVLVLERFVLFNQAGSSCDLARMFRTCYTENFMADLAFQSLDLWKELEREAGEPLRVMSGLLNFGDPKYDGGPEGNLLDPLKNLDRLGMKYHLFTTVDEIEKEYPFKNLPRFYEGYVAEDNGVINLPLLLRTLHRLFLKHGGAVHTNAQVQRIDTSANVTSVHYTDTTNPSAPVAKVVTTHQVVLAAGAYTNHILTPSFNLELDLDIWEMTSSYYSFDPNKQNLFPSMWFLFAEDDVVKHKAKFGKVERVQKSNLMYGFPDVAWGVPHTFRIAVDAAINRITDPNARHTHVIAQEDVQKTTEWVHDHIRDVLPQPQFSCVCLQTNVIDNHFVLDFVPGHKNVVVFTAGWAMKFVPLIGIVLKDLLATGSTQYDISHFKITRPGVLKQKIHEISSIRNIVHSATAEISHPKHLGALQHIKRAIDRPARGSSAPLRAPHEVVVQRPRRPTGSIRERIVQKQLETQKVVPPLSRLNRGNASLVRELASPTAINVLRAQYEQNLKFGARKQSPLTVGIIGGGMAGLYAAMILQSLNIPYQVLESNPIRWGGRVYTQHFPELGSVYDYVDLGAMRFPELDIMDRVFDLWRRIGVDKLSEPYILGTDTNFKYYNGRRIRASEYNVNTFKDDPLGFSESKGGGVPDSYVRKGDGYWVDKAIRPFLDALKEDFVEGFEMLQAYDGLSTRAFLSTFETEDEGVPIYGYPSEVVDWLETLNTGTGLYDHSFTETVMDSLDFDGEVDWHCLRGGTEVMTDAMVKSLNASNLHKGRVVGSIRPTETGIEVGYLNVNPKIGQGVYPQSAGEKIIKENLENATFKHVISTVPLSVLRLIELSECNISYDKTAGSRMLAYDHSVKIALVFKHRWWQDPAWVNPPIFGGSSSTDLPVRTVVYPSQGIADSTAPGILMVSYSWSQDASRMGSLTLDDNYMIYVCLSNLSDIHGIPIDRLRAEFTNKFSIVDWDKESGIHGAFALFRPAQFITTFSGTSSPEMDGYLHFAGEALSVHHAWIVGSLVSAYRTVAEVLEKENPDDPHALDELIRLWGTIDEPDFAGLSALVPKHK